MPTIIKAADSHLAVQRVAFNFEDMASKASQYLEAVRAEAAQIVSQAHHEAEAIRQQAQREGQKAGRAAIEQIVQAQLAQQLATVLPALRQAIDEIRHTKQAWLNHWEQTAVHVAAAIAARLIRRELSTRPEITLDLVREALELATGSTEVRIHLHPADHAALGSQVEAIAKELSPLAPAEIVADPQIAAGACRVETRFGVIDQQWDAQLARIEEELA